MENSIGPVHDFLYSAFGAVANNKSFNAHFLRS